MSSPEIGGRAGWLRPSTGPMHTRLRCSVGLLLAACASTPSPVVFAPNTVAWTIRELEYPIRALEVVAMVPPGLVDDGELLDQGRARLRRLLVGFLRQMMGPTGCRSLDRSAESEAERRVALKRAALVESYLAQAQLIEPYVMADGTRLPRVRLALDDFEARFRVMFPGKNPDPVRRVLDGGAPLLDCGTNR